jgi:endo-1,4-beta-xylanase
MQFKNNVSPHYLGYRFLFIFQNITDFKISILLVSAFVLFFYSESFSQPLAFGKTKFLGNGITYGTSIPSNYTTYWDQVTPGNDGKWGSVEEYQGKYNFTSLDNIYNFALSNDMPFKEHNLIWGSQQPSFMTNGSLDSAQEYQEIVNWIDTVGHRYPNAAFCDVVNEPINTPPPYLKALGGAGKTGYDWIVTAFTLARKSFASGTKLLVNEYNVLGTTSNTNEYIAIIDTLKARGLIDGIGIQGHYFEFKSYQGATNVYAYPVSTITSNLARIIALGLPVYISEFDINESNDSVQAANYQTYFPIFWNNPGIKGMTLWGYNQNDTWEPNAYLVRSNGTERPALQWLRKFLSTDNFQSFQSGNWENVNTWSWFNDSTWINPAPHVPSLSDGAITILSGHTVTATATDTVNKLNIASGGTLVVNSNANFIVQTNPLAPLANLIVGGTLSNAGTITQLPSALVTVASGGKYAHVVDGSSIPTASWASGSMCEFDGIKTTVPSNVNQNFYNITWNCLGQTGNLSLNWSGIKIGGNITVQSTGTGILEMCSPLSGTADTVTVSGAINQSGGQFTANGSNNSNTTVVVNHSGNINVTGGDFSISRGSQGGTGITIWNLDNGNFSMSNASAQNLTTTPGGAKFVFAATGGSQTLTLGTGNSISSLPIEIRSGATLYTGTSSIAGTGSFSLDSGATIICGNSNGIDGLLSTSGAVSLSQSATYAFNGLSAQITGKMMPGQVSVLNIDNALGVTLSKSLLVSGTVNMQSGTLSLSNDTISYGVNANLVYGGRPAQTSSIAEFPISNGPTNIKITNANGVTLTGSRVITGSLDLTSNGKFILGNNNFTASAIKNTTSIYHVITNGIGALILPSGSSASVLYPIGTKSGYAPVTIMNNSTSDTTGVSVMDDSSAAPYGGRVLVHWNITGSDTIKVNDAIQFCWVYGLEDNIFKNNMQNDSRIFLISGSDTIESGSGAYSYQLTSPLYSVLRSGITQLGTFYVGSFINQVEKIEENVKIPKEYALTQNYPNPFNPSTVIRYSLPNSGLVKLTIYNLMGQKITTLVNKQQSAGSYEVSFDASGLSSGIYFYHLESGKFSQVKKMMFLK